MSGEYQTTGVTSRAGTVNPSGAPEFTPGFERGSCFSSFSFMCMFYRSLFVHLSFFFRPLCCLYFFKSRLLITPLVSSNFSMFTLGHTFWTDRLCIYSIMLWTWPRWLNTNFIVFVWSHRDWFHHLPHITWPEMTEQLWDQRKTLQKLQHRKLKQWR